MAQVVIPTYIPSYWYDRTIGVSLQLYDATVGPHAQTQRWSYTVPGNLNAWLNSVVISLTRLSAASTVGLVSAWVNLQVDGVLQSLVLQFMASNVVGYVQQIALPVGVCLPPGSEVVANTSDTSIGGSVTYQVGACLNTFSML